MFLFILIFTLIFIGCHSRQDVFYTPYGPSAQYAPQRTEQFPYPYETSHYGSPMGRSMLNPQMDGGCGRSLPPQPPPPPVPCNRALAPPDPEMVVVPSEAPKQPKDAQQPNAVPEAPCDKPGSENMPLDVLCSLPPHKGTGNDDIFRYYYNPVVQQCIPFSYSGKGGNANRFVSVKNCYEICHPADPTVKKPRVVSGIKAYLVPNLKRECNKDVTDDGVGYGSDKKRRKPPHEVVIRQIPHPLDPTKTLTIIQNAQYITSAQFGAGGKGLQGSQGFPKPQEIDPNLRRVYQYETVPEYIPAPYGQPSYG